MSIKQLIYVSALSKSQDPSCLAEILRQSIRNNAANNITGMLLYINGSFLQVLEGEPETLEPLYVKICADPRHTGAVKVLDIEVEERQFSEWSMGHATLSGGELDRLSGKNDFFTRGHCLTELDSGIARRVLTQFREGLWRRRIS